MKKKLQKKLDEVKKHLIKALKAKSPQKESKDKAKKNAVELRKIWLPKAARKQLKSKRVSQFIFAHIIQKLIRKKGY